MTMPLETSGVPFVFDNDAVVEVNGVELNCIINKLTLKPDTATVTSTTLCGATDYPGATKWTFGGTLYQSFEANGAYDVLSAAVIGGVPVPFKVGFSRSAPATANPQFSGMAVPRPFTIVDSDAGALVEVEFEWGCTEPPMEDYGTGPQPIGTQAAAAMSAMSAPAKQSGSTVSAPATASA